MKLAHYDFNKNEVLRQPFLLNLNLYFDINLCSKCLRMYFSIGSDNFKLVNDSTCSHTQITDFEYI